MADQPQAQGPVDRPDALFDQPLVHLAPATRTRLRIRLLDPVATAGRASRRATAPTAYRSDRLLVRGDRVDDAAAALERAGEQAGIPLTVSSTNVFDGDGQQQQALPGELEVPRGPDAPEDPIDRALWLADVAVLELAPRDPDADPGLVDAWQLLQLVAADPDAPRLHLDHVHVTHSGGSLSGHPMTGHPMTGHPMTGHPMTGHPMTGHPMTGHHARSALAGYAVAGWGGRTPVVVESPPPQPPMVPDGKRAPVVVIADSAIMPHAWLPEGQDAKPQEPGLVVRDPRIDPSASSRLIGPTPTERQQAGFLPATAAGVSNPLVGDLDTSAGHGTFMAGLVRQRCPAARILGINLVGEDGVITDSLLVPMLQRLLLRQVLALVATPEAVVDILVLSMGTYLESAEDEQLVSEMAGPLRALGLVGVAVVASAGNDATSVPCFPAAFAPGGPASPPHPDAVHQVTVGATNPDGTVALFSNEGAWVGRWERGASVMSTYPSGMDGSGQPGARIKSPAGHRRAAFDPDDYTSGFAVWSGTSFAAPSHAGMLAHGGRAEQVWPDLEVTLACLVDRARAVAQDE